MIHWVSGFRDRWGFDLKDKSVGVYDFKGRFPDIYNKWSEIFYEKY
jgi:hypothetical protein